MTRDAALKTLQAAETSLKSRGVVRAALFGSVARDEAQPTSDVDVVIEIEPDATMDVFRYIEIVQTLKDLFTIRVDVSNRAQLKSHVRSNVERDAIYAF